MWLLETSWSGCAGVTTRQKYNSLLQVDYSIIASQAGATLNNLMSHAQELVAKLRSLQFDLREFVCLKFLVLFSLGMYTLFFISYLMVLLLLFSKNNESILLFFPEKRSFEIYLMRFTVIWELFFKYHLQENYI